jgi:hypothetical protein
VHHAPKLLHSIWCWVRHVLLLLLLLLLLLKLLQLLLLVHVLLLVLLLQQSQPARGCSPACRAGHHVAA